MVNILQNLFRQGLGNTIELRAKKGFSSPYKFQRVYENTVVDEFFLGDFCSAFYDVSVQLDTERKETMQVVITGRPQNVSITVYGRVFTKFKMIELDAIVDNSRCYLIARPLSYVFDGAKINFSAKYFRTLDPLLPPDPDVRTYDSSFGKFDSVRITFDKDEEI